MINVTVRKKKLRDGNFSLFLDITGAGDRKKDYLGYKIYVKPKNQEERAHNQKYLALANDVAVKREYDLRGNDQGLKNIDKGKIDIVDFFKEYIEGYGKKDKRLVEAAQSKFNDFLKAKHIRAIPGRALTSVLCEEFGTYLRDACDLHGETPQNYFKKFRMVIRDASKKGITAIDTRDLRVKFVIDHNAIKKPILSPEEILKLIETPEQHDMIRRAYLFSLNTGFDHITVSNLYWWMVDENGITFDRSKTSSQNRLPLNKSARMLMGGRGEPDDIIFELPGHGKCVRVLRRWAANAKVDKAITWHSARHSLGTNLVNEYSTDVAVVSKILGHKDIRTTMKYVHVNTKAKKSALDSLPDMPIEKKDDKK